jgi:hypothetical protein
MDTDISSPKRGRAIRSERMLIIDFCILRTGCLRFCMVRLLGETGDIHPAKMY